MKIRKVDTNELFEFVTSLKMTQNEAMFVNEFLDMEPGLDDTTLITFDKIEEILKTVREKIPEKFRSGPLFGAN